MKKNNYSIFSICTENYRDAMDFVLESWLKYDNVDNIYIYTDFNIENNIDDRVKILNTLNKTDDWLEIVGFKAIILNDFINKFNVNNFAFIDIDCYMIGDVSDIFNEDFDIAVTRMYNKRDANSGVWFCKNNENIKMFSEKWMDLQLEYKNKNIGVRKHSSSYSQRSFSHILHAEHKNLKYLKVLPIDKKYNYEEGKVDEWVSNVNKYNPKILHFKKRRWRNKLALDIFNEIKMKV